MRQDSSRDRSSISHILTALALVLAVLVLYRSWIKPAYFPTVAPPSQSSETPAVPPSLDLTIPIEDNRGSAAVPRIRLVDPGDAPSPELSHIRDELEKGNLRQVEPALRKLSRKIAANSRISRYIAALWNNLGIQQERFGGSALSVKSFQEAAKLDPRSTTALSNLTQAYWELRHPAMTPQFLETVTRVAPEDPFPHLALADILLGQGQVASASAHLGEARKLASNDPGLVSYLKKLTARAEVMVPQHQTVTKAVARPTPTIVLPARSPAAPSDSIASAAVKPTSPALPIRLVPPDEPPRQLSTPENARFVVQYDGLPDQPTWMRMKAILDYAFDEISQKFGHVPSKPIPVVLHTNQKFAGAAGSPAWADTLFDATSGAIHVPVQGALDDLAFFSRIVRHEFVHAFLFEYMKGRSSAAPTWLMEGLAVQLSEDPWPELEEAKLQATAAIPLVSLQGDWKQRTQESALRAYIEASGATQQLIDRYSVYSVRQVINLLRAGESLDGAMRQKLSVSYDQFQRQWEQDRIAVARQAG